MAVGHRQAQVFGPIVDADEQLYRDGVRMGENRVGAYGHTLGGSVGLAMIETEADVTDELIATGSWELDIVGTPYPVTLSLRPMYDPGRLRIKA